MKPNNVVQILRGKSKAILVILLLFCMLFQLQAQGKTEKASQEAQTASKEELTMAEHEMEHETNHDKEHAMEHEMEHKQNVIYLAGGCFWGLEHLMQSLNGVIDAQSGYANGKRAEDANYKTIIKGGTGYKETVKVTYDPNQTSLDAILFAYFYVIDPTVKNRQGNDIGEQYQTGIYYTNGEQKAVVDRIVAIEKSRAKKFYVEVEPLQNFYLAEDYHQDYLVKNPFGYCHIPRSEMQLLASLKIDPGKYLKPAQELIKENLTALQYEVTQNNTTERPFANEYWNKFDAGIYVDIVTGEPLFSSLDKFESSCGWPAFSSPIEAPSVVELVDTSHGMVRTEVRSRAGDSHLGHVFQGDRESPNGVRYCINSASIRFIPYPDMDKEGYGYLKYLFE